jgi:hypothetical protein
VGIASLSLAMTEKGKACNDREKIEKESDKEKVV